MAARTLEHLLRPRTAAPGLDVFAVEHTSAQLVWSDLGEGTIRIEIAADGRPTRRLERAVSRGPGTLELDELTPGTRHQLIVHGPDGATRSRRLATLVAPPGEEVFRFATVSDLHLGRGGGYRVSRALARPEVEPSHGGDAEVEPSRGGAAGGAGGAGATTSSVRTEPARDEQYDSAAAAIREALDWGAQHLVVKGDLCDETYDWIWDQAGALLGDLPVPVSIIPGNHDTGALRHFEPEDGAAGRGLHLTRGVEHVDVPGLRIVLLDSTRPGTGWGAVARHGAQVAALAAEAPGGVFVATHHHPQRFAVPVFWPHGIPAADARRFTTELHAASSSVLVSSGHTHRCRRRRVHGVDWSEVAATSHFPGVWAGYVVHEGGIIQTVRRIADPAVLRWSESTRHMLRGAWALWSAGQLSDRSFVLTWP